MKLLLDANLSPQIASHLVSAGYEAIHVRDVQEVTAEGIAQLLLDNLEQVASALESGAIVSMVRDRIRIHYLPIE